ncbi:MAG: hypothetical protein GY804_01815 [Alphaproteobacteria bacterium]|nr:hypothetical protein [Alphaproteobacteria bacterium]
MKKFGFVFGLVIIVGWVWGGKEVLHAMNDFEITALKKGAENEVVIKVENVFKAIRRDLGYNDATMQDGELLSLLIRADEKETIIKQASNKEK